MSLNIDADRVIQVLVADTWWTVEWLVLRPAERGRPAMMGSSFALDAYEFITDGDLVLPAGSVAGVPTVGFRFIPSREPGREVFGPLTSLQGVKLRD